MKFTLIAHVHQKKNKRAKRKARRRKEEKKPLQRVSAANIATTPKYLSIGLSFMYPPKVH